MIENITSFVSTSFREITGTKADEDSNEKNNKNKKPRKKRKKKKKKIYYAPPSQWKVSDFWPEGQWESEGGMGLGGGGLDISQQLSERSSSVTGSAMAGVSRGRIDSVSSLDSMLDDASNGSADRVSPVFINNPHELDTVTDQIKSFENLTPLVHNAIEKAGQGESRVLGQYNKRDRTRAALLTAAIKAVIIDEIRVEAAERIHDPVESVLETLEGRMAEAAFDQIFEMMTRKGGGIKVLKHPRSVKPPRVVKLKFKKMEDSKWLINSYEVRMDETQKWQRVGHINASKLCIKPSRDSPRSWRGLTCDTRNPLRRTKTSCPGKVHMMSTMATKRTMADTPQTEWKEGGGLGGRSRAQRE
jgi:hypothetical protein